MVQEGENDAPNLETITAMLPPMENSIDLNMVAINSMEEFVNDINNVNDTNLLENINYGSLTSYSQLEQEIFDYSDRDLKMLNLYI